MNEVNKFSLLRKILSLRVRAKQSKIIKFLFCGLLRFTRSRRDTSGEWPSFFVIASRRTACASNSEAIYTVWITSGFALVMTMHFCHCERMRGNLRHCDWERSNPNSYNKAVLTPCMLISEPLTNFCHCEICFTNRSNPK